MLELQIVTEHSNKYLLGLFTHRYPHSPDTSAIGPVAGHASAGKQGRDGLVKEEVIVDQLFLLSISHGLQGVVFSLELTIQAGQSCTNTLIVRCFNKDKQC